MTDALRNPFEFGAEDLVMLEEISEDAILANLSQRFDAAQIYTYIGSVLVSMNPYRMIEGMYTDARIAQYRDKMPYENSPHVYALADSVYRSMKYTRKDQCIIISGESGSGKTEASKKIMQYISAVTGGNSEVERVKKVIIDSNPVLEAFGNAKTVQNNNSSRFGKYFEIQFDYGANPYGGRITQYLLEKSRVVQQVAEERNFHVFYQLLEGASGAEKKKLHLGGEFKYVNRLKVKGMDDAQEYKATRASMKAVGMSDEQQAHIFATLAGIMHLGNIEFTAADSCAVSTPDALKTCAEVLSVDAAALETALVYRSIKVGSEVTKVPQNAEGAAFSRDALAKAVYSRLFTWIVEFINKSIFVEEYDTVIGVLDIYGFEVFESNSFEQLCINFANEKLQQVFINQTLKSEQQEYVAEGIKWTEIEFFDNKTVCDLIENAPMGLIPLLDSECVMPKGEDTGFLRKCYKGLEQNPHFERPKAGNFAMDSSFTLRHYAGDVVYDVTGWMAKNRDTLFTDLKLLFTESPLEFHRELFAADVAAMENKRRPPTVGTQFKKQINALVSTLEACVPHYIRCIRPNSKKRAMSFERELVLHQVKYLGIKENVRVRRAGFAYRAEYARFLARYKMVDDKTWPNPPAGMSDRDACQAIVDGRPDKVVHQAGNTKMFVKEPQAIVAMEAERGRRITALVTRVQALWKGYRARVFYERLLAANVIKRHYRVFQARKFSLAWRAEVEALYDGKKVRRQATLHRNYGGNCLDRNFAAEEFDKLLRPKGATADRKFIYTGTVARWNHAADALEPRELWLTAAHVFLLQLPFDKKGRPKVDREFAIADVRGVQVTTLSDELIIFSLPESKDGDVVLSCAHKSELLLKLRAAVVAAGGTAPPLTLDASLSFKVKKAEAVTVMCELDEAADATVWSASGALLRVVAGGKTAIKPEGWGEAADEDEDEAAVDLSRPRASSFAPKLKPDIKVATKMEKRLSKNLSKLDKTEAKEAKQLEKELGKEVKSFRSSMGRDLKARKKEYRKSALKGKKGAELKSEMQAYADKLAAEEAAAEAELTAKQGMRKKELRITQTKRRHDAELAALIERQALEVALQAKEGDVDVAALEKAEAAKTKATLKVKKKEAKKAGGDTSAWEAERAAEVAAAVAALKATLAEAKAKLEDDHRYQQLYHKKKAATEINDIQLSSGA